jgi:peptidoglycan/xylan/chitin deacetylase (PgdA/CDA1 family)
MTGSDGMNVFLTFDIELWCSSWKTLDADFPRARERYIYGRSRHGDYALPKTLDILGKHGVHGVFFVEPLFSARFGIEHLATVVDLILSAGHEIQLHLHPEWTDEIRPALIPNVERKRQHLSYYNLEEQTALIRHGLRMLADVGALRVNAFRAGSFAANAATFDALSANGIVFDSSLDPTVAISAPELQSADPAYSPRRIGGIVEYPITVFRDGLGKLRHAQVGACSAGELARALERAARAGTKDFVIFSHNFEMLKPGSTEPDWIVVRRFEKLCELLSRVREWRTIGFHEARTVLGSVSEPGYSSVEFISTGVRLVEQALRRIGILNSLFR